MTAYAAVRPFFGTDQWNAEVYGSLSIASEIASMVKNRSKNILLAYKLHALNRHLARFFEQVHDQMEGKRTLPAGKEPPTEEEYQKAVKSLQDLSRSMYVTYETCKRLRLTNNSLLAGSIARLRTYSEELSELAEWLETGGQKDVFADVFMRSEQEKERGDIYDLSQVS